MRKFLRLLLLTPLVFMVGQVFAVTYTVSPTGWASAPTSDYIISCGDMFYYSSPITITEKGSEGNIVWCMVTDKNQKIPMSQVGMLVAVDDSPYFSVLDVQGNVIAENVLQVHFLKTEPTGLKNIVEDELQNILKRYVNNQLTLVGASGIVNIYSVSGVIVASTQAMGQETIIDVSTLPVGTYVLICGNQSFKFIKK